MSLLTLSEILLPNYRGIFPSRLVLKIKCVNCYKNQCKNEYETKLTHHSVEAEVDTSQDGEVVAVDSFQEEKVEEFLIHLS